MSTLRNYLRQPHVAAQLHELRQLTSWRFVLAVAGNYLAIGGVIAVATVATSAFDTMGLVWFAGAILIAARQHALLVLMHEGAHRTASSNRATNDILADLLCGAPLLVSVRSYRRDHLAHHQHLNTQSDPDWCRKTDDQQQRGQWLFPVTQALPLVLAKLYGYSVTYLLRSLIANQSGTKPKSIQHQPSDKTLGYLRYGLYASAAITLTLTDTWPGFIAYWLAPMLLILPLIMRIRSIAEHFALRHDHPLTQSRTIRAGLIERALIAPHHIGLHIDHHLLASVPFYNLPALHRLLLDCPYYESGAHLNEGYFVRRTFGYPNIPVEPTLTTLAEDMYTLPSTKLPPILSGDAANNEHSPA